MRKWEKKKKSKPQLCPSVVLLKESALLAKDRTGRLGFLGSENKGETEVTLVVFKRLSRCM